MISNTITGRVYIVGDNIDTDQIIPAQYLALVPTIPEEYRQLGTYALCGLPRDKYPTRLIPNGDGTSPYSIIIAGRNFGCGSSREHAPIALGAAGIRAVVAQSFARIFFRNCIATGELLPVECATCCADVLSTGDEVTITLDQHKLSSADGSFSAQFPPLGEVQAVVSAGGLFAYAREKGLVPQRGAS